MMRMVTCERVLDEIKICPWHVLLTDLAVVGWSGEVVGGETDVYSS